MLATWPVHPKCGRALFIPGPIVVPDPLPENRIAQLLQFCRALLQGEDGERQTRYFCPFGSDETVTNDGFEDPADLRLHFEVGHVGDSLADTGTPSESVRSQLR